LDLRGLFLYRPEAPLAAAQQLEFMLVMLLDGVAMADADHDAVRQFGAQHLVEREFQSLVESRGGFVEEYRLGFGQQDAGKSDTLLLTRGEHFGPILLFVEPSDQR